MSAIYTYPNKATLKAVAADLVQDMGLSNPIFQYVFPIQERNDLVLRWYVDDLMRGVMALRGAGGAPSRVDLQGRNYFETNPGVFGEYSALDEVQLMKLAAGIPDTMQIPVSVSDEIARIQKYLLNRQQNRMRVMGWTAVLTGALSIPLPAGGIGYTDSFTIQTRTVSPLWSSPTTAHPLKDLQDNQFTYGRGTSNQFGANAVALCNTKTFNYILNNTNAADWGGKRTSGGGTPQTMGFYDEIRMGYGIPRFILWDDGYINESGSFVLDIPDGKVVLVAQRPDGELPGEFSLTYNAVDQAPGAYTFITDNTKGPEKEVPPTIKVDAGFNGGLVYSRPTQVLIMTVA